MTAGIALWLCLVLPSLFSVQKYLGWLGAYAYLIVAAFAVWSMSRHRWSIDERQAWRLCVGTFVLLAVIFTIGYPIANVHTPALGSDDDDAMNLAIGELAHGRYPYYAVTYLGNLIHHLPGAFLLAAPFVLIGTSALQNLFWLVLLYLVLYREFSSSAAALRWFWLLLIFSPVVVHQVINGTGHVANAIYVMAGLIWLITAEHKTLPAAAWGVALSSRANFLFLIPLAFGWLAQRFGWRIAFRLVLLTCSSCALLTLPFYLYDPHGFAPFDAADRLMRFNEVLPYAGFIIGINMAFMSVMLAWRPMRTSSVLWLSCALVQSVPVIAGYLLGGESAFLAYGTFALPFGILAAATSFREVPA